MANVALADSMCPHWGRAARLRRARGRPHRRPAPSGRASRRWRGSLRSCRRARGTSGSFAGPVPGSPFPIAPSRRTSTATDCVAHRASRTRPSPRGHPTRRRSRAFPRTGAGSRGVRARARGLVEEDPGLRWGACIEVAPPLEEQRRVVRLPLDRSRKWRRLPKSARPSLQFAESLPDSRLSGASAATASTIGSRVRDVACRAGAPPGSCGRSGRWIDVDRPPRRGAASSMRSICSNMRPQTLLVSTCSGASESATR